MIDMHSKRLALLFALVVATTFLLTACILFNSPPSVVLNAVPGGGQAPLLVAFDAGASNDPDGTIVAYEWDFGDGAHGSGVALAHTYSAPGAYEVQLTVRDDAGWRNYAYFTIYVGDSISYDDLFRDNEDYIGCIVYFRGEIIQVREFLGAYDWRVATGESQYLGYIEDIVWVNYSGPRFLEGDLIDFCGEVTGLKTYTAIFGQQVTIPEIKALWASLSE